MRKETRKKAKVRTAGVLFLVVMAAFVTLSIKIYDKDFITSIPVTLHADRVGNQLIPGGEVKARGVKVGEITAVRATPAGAELDLAMEPDKIGKLPTTVSALLVPKTLFGERYVALQIPRNPSPQHISAGDVIPQDHSQTAIELERVLDNLLPLLQDVQPQKLSATLGALSQALDGRGTQLGGSLVKLDHYLTQLNTALPDIKADITGLADLGDTYNRAAPDLIAALSDLTVTSKTIVDQRRDFDATFRSLTTTSGTLQDFLEVNRSNLIGLSADSRPTLELLERYSPEFPCLLGQLSTLAPRIDQAFRNEELHIDLEITQNRGNYVPGDEPQYLDHRGPRCYNLPPDIMAPQNPPGGPLKDGSRQPAVSKSTDQFNRDHPDADQISMLPPPTAPQSASFDPMDLGVANSPGEQQLIAELIAPGMGRAPGAVPSWSSFLVGGLLRGTEVTLR